MNLPCGPISQTVTWTNGSPVRRNLTLQEIINSVDKYLGRDIHYNNVCGEKQIFSLKLFKIA